MAPSSPSQNMLSRITRDIGDGLLVLDSRGTFLFANPMAETFLGVGPLPAGCHYAETVMQDSPENDAFHQFLIDAVTDKKHTHKGKVTYLCPDGTKKIFRMSSSFLFAEDGLERQGAVIQFSDVTSEEKLRKHYKDTVLVFLLLFVILCLWNFVYTVWHQTGEALQTGWMTVMVELAAIAAFFVIRKFTDLDLADMGLRIRGWRKYLLIDGIFTAVILGLMLLAKALILRFFPDVYGPGARLVDFSSLTVFDYIYPLTVVLQEFLSRGVMHEAVRSMIPGKHANTLAILVSSLFFGALHVHLGLAFMVGAALLLGLFGVIYTRQRTIWGLCIPHYFLGIALTVIFQVG